MAGDVTVGDAVAFALPTETGSSAFASPKSSTFHHAVRSQLDVGGFQVTVHDALFVCRFQGFSNLLGNWECFIDCNRPLRDTVCERWTFDELHDERLHTVRLLQTVDMRDVRVIQRRKDLRFPLESPESLGVRRESIRQHLQGIVPFEPRVMRPPDLAHAAFANQGGDFIGAEATAGPNGHLRGILRHERRCAANRATMVECVLNTGRPEPPFSRFTGLRFPVRCRMVLPGRSIPTAAIWGITVERRACCCRRSCRRKE